MKTEMAVFRHGIFQFEEIVLCILIWAVFIWFENTSCRVQGSCWETSRVQRSTVKMVTIHFLGESSSAAAHGFSHCKRKNLSGEMNGFSCEPDTSPLSAHYPSFPRNCGFRCSLLSVHLVLAAFLCGCHAPCRRRHCTNRPDSFPYQTLLQFLSARFVW